MVIPKFQKNDPKNPKFVKLIFIIKKYNFCVFKDFEKNGIYVMENILNKYVEV